MGPKTKFKRRKIDKLGIFSDDVYRLILENAPESIAVLSPEGKIIELNHAFKKATGWSREDVIGKSFTVFCTAPETRALADFAKLKTVKHIGLKEGAIRTKSGKVFPIEYIVVPIIR